MWYLMGHGYGILYSICYMVCGIWFPEFGEVEVSDLG